MCGDEDRDSLGGCWRRAEVGTGDEDADNRADRIHVSPNWDWPSFPRSISAPPLPASCTAAPAPGPSFCMFFGFAVANACSSSPAARTSAPLMML